MAGKAAKSAGKKPPCGDKIAVGIDVDDVGLTGIRSRAINAGVTRTFECGKKRRSPYSRLCAPAPAGTLGFTRAHRKPRYSSESSFPLARGRVTMFGRFFGMAEKIDLRPTGRRVRVSLPSKRHDNFPASDVAFDQQNRLLVAEQKAPISGGSVARRLWATDSGEIPERSHLRGTGFIHCTENPQGGLCRSGRSVTKASGGLDAAGHRAALWGGPCARPWPKSGFFETGIGDL